MHPRALSLALALLLLVTQQFGLQHMLSHALRAPAGNSMPAAAGADRTEAAPAGSEQGADPSADGLCQTCLTLAALGAASLPMLLRWRAMHQRSSTPTSPVHAAPARRAATPYLARAPPARPALT